MSQIFPHFVKNIVLFLWGINYLSLDNMKWFRSVWHFCSFFANFVSKFSCLANDWHQATHDQIATTNVSHKYEKHNKTTINAWLLCIFRWCVEIYLSKEVRTIPRDIKLACLLKTFAFGWFARFSEDDRISSRMFVKFFLLSEYIAVWIQYIQHLNA